MPLEFEGGRQVTAVAPPAGKLAVLSRKAGAAGVTIRTVESWKADHSGDGTAHLASSVFTGIAYVLDAEELVRSFRAVAQALKPGSLLLVDVPRRGIFASGAQTTRRVRVSPETDEMFLHEEDTRVKRGDRWLEVRDAFRMRCWTPDAVRLALQKAGFTLARHVSRAFAFTGAHYWCYRRT